jgi:hypothetical protein
MNTCLDPTLDKRGGRHENQTHFAKQLKELVEQNDLTDIWRTLNPDKKRFTWRQNSAKGIIQSRLDYWFISNNLVYDVHKCDIQNVQYSDHNPINIDLHNKEKPTPGRGFWKFNVSLLKDKEYLDKVNDKIDECTKRYNQLKDKGLLWDAVKAEVRGLTISHATKKAREKREVVKTLNQELTELEISIAASPDQDILLQINTRIKELEQINNETTRGLIIQSKCKILNEYEKNSKLDRKSVV